MVTLIKYTASILCQEEMTALDGLLKQSCFHLANTEVEILAVHPRRKNLALKGLRVIKQYINTSVQDQHILYIFFPAGSYSFLWKMSWSTIINTSRTVGGNFYIFLILILYTYSE